ncbi:hypothetical protein O6H91_11G054100 [Diphasiastrum complanatum]|uniref:Uncharacterized protein n=1 Tax=Diphasiastrum complanatum TaxID=34168 RepID=A0ACC2C943_DIPCM|nr:hypothetical protein O6H91_11G054100 [Diphasiastrum complanatum]
MGKNQAYKAMQRAKMSSHTPGATDELEDGMMDGSFHSPEWHAARLASLQTSHTITWEEYRQRLKEEAKRKGELEDSEARMMREYRAQLDAERASKLARGRNHVNKDDLKKGKDKAKDKERDKKNGKKHKTEKRRRPRHETDSDSDATGDEERSLSRKKRRKLRKERNERKHRRPESQSGSSRGQSSSENDTDTYGPLPLSSFFENGKG